MTDADRRAADIENGRKVLRTEGAALAAYADDLGERFADAVAAMHACEGRVVVCGMGKSGHVGRKIAATLASTGTPAFFLHPGEASHGDLGMLTRADVALVLSNSGATPELSDVIAHTRRFSIPLIGVASKMDSPLMQAADIPLALPRAPEACPMGLAPTTSTTLTLGLGDALAVALMERREFKPEDFRTFHPGGKLGARLLKVDALMHSGDMPLVGLDTPMTEALLVISRHGFGVAGVIDDAGRLAGVITDGDLRRKMEGLLERTAREVMTANPVTIPPRALAQEAMALMNDRKITCLFVVDPDGGGAPAGVMHVHDCLRAGLDSV
ncbi:KpsF/GutQ family sugar-phosphate isomerase [Rhodovulum sp. DZ06]|uniref:KpsF/GutQ family sugar-phosphate isomerase n=1 Tax=Rhodovulum sp. DZ06 TaxID=3425126 RepID=UPI003D33B739